MQCQSSLMKRNFATLKHHFFGGLNKWILVLCSDPFILLFHLLYLTCKCCHYLN